MLAQVFNTTVDSVMELNPGVDPRNLQIGQVITLAPGYQYYESYPDQPTENMTDTSMMMDLTSYLRLLWEQHVVWTRMTIMALIHELPEAQLITQRLLRNAVDFAEALANFYGEETAQEFSDLFTQHITIAAELVQAAKSGDNAAYTEIEQRWYNNADQIAAYLAEINPYWNEDDWEAMLDEHLGLLSANVADMVTQNYAASIEGYDDIELHALEMADMMAEGISMQFPD
jgi:hypothetical protein